MLKLQNERLRFYKRSSVETRQSLAIFQTLEAFNEEKCRGAPNNVHATFMTFYLNINNWTHMPDEIHSNYLHISNNEILAIIKNELASDNLNDKAHSLLVRVALQLMYSTHLRLPSFLHP